MANGKRVLILSASAGAGHVRAAEALVAAFGRHPTIVAPGGGVEHWDMLKYTSKTFRYIYSKLYLDLVNKAPSVLGYAYKLTDHPWKQDRGRMAFEKFNARPFLKALTDYQPDVIVCTHFTPPFLVSWLYEQGKLKVRPAVVLTDLDIHAMWLARHYEHYFVALEESRVYLEKVGISPGRITVSGVPVDTPFTVAKDQATARRELADLGVDPQRFTVLVSAGGFGVGPIAAMIGELLTMRVPAQVIAIAGKSESLKTKLDTLAKESATGTVKLIPIGFTKQMDLFMAAADILLSKPGGLTVSEAMARGLPMCIANPIPGQEERNSDHLLEAGVAIKCNNLLTLGYKLEQLVQTPGRLDTMRTKAKAFGKPHAAEAVVRTLLG